MTKTQTQTLTHSQLAFLIHSLTHSFIYALTFFFLTLFTLIFCPNLLLFLPSLVFTLFLHVLFSQLSLSCTPNFNTLLIHYLLRLRRIFLYSFTLFLLFFPLPSLISHHLFQSLTFLASLFLLFSLPPPPLHSRHLFQSLPLLLSLSFSFSSALSFTPFQAPLPVPSITYFHISPFSLPSFRTHFLADLSSLLCPHSPYIHLGIKIHLTSSFSPSPSPSHTPSSSPRHATLLVHPLLRLGLK